MLIPEYIPKNKQSTKSWTAASKILSIDPPVFAYNGDVKGGHKKLFKVSFKYTLFEGDKTHRKTILFGDPTGQYIIDKDESKRKKRFDRLPCKQNPLKPNFWRLQLLNTQQTIEEAYTSLLSRLMKNN